MKTEDLSTGDRLRKIAGPLGESEFDMRYRIEFPKYSNLYRAGSFATPIDARDWLVDVLVDLGFIVSSMYADDSTVKIGINMGRTNVVYKHWKLEPVDIGDSIA